MKYSVIETIDLSNKYPEGVYLIKNGWDDWFTYRITYTVLFSYSVNSNVINLGSVKIGDFENTKPCKALPSTFNQLSNDYFSMGTDESFYAELNRKEVKDHREAILYGLNDIALDVELYEKAKKTDVFRVSISRGIGYDTMESQFRKMASGDAELTDYHFRYSTDHIESKRSKISLDFNIENQNHIPTNIHAIIGRNGVGKSFLLSSMIKSLVEVEKDGGFEIFGQMDSLSFFSKLVTINFSSFEDKKIYKDNLDSNNSMIYHHIGSTMMMKDKETNDYLPKYMSPDDLMSQFVESVTKCIENKPTRWTECMDMLNSDPVFEGIKVRRLIFNFYADKSPGKNEYINQAQKLYKNLSSGHKIVILTVCKLVELATERTLIIMDEPELHLHPPLLSSLIRTISFLLRKVNGAAIMATHSPIVLQEIPTSCIWKLELFGDNLSAERFDMSTFGENISTLNREVFSYEVTQSGFHNLLKEAVRDYPTKSFNDFIEFFNDELGIEAMGILRVLVRKRDENL
ncbi:AAA family ATPase [Carnobacterium sp. FSL E2-0243]|uniref:AAA family ATPase n=1 Tax=Carnobacterium sp. FSL E2-0243 TaxID=2921365 RepID=UPI0030F8E2C9